MRARRRSRLAQPLAGRVLLVLLAGCAAKAPPTVVPVPELEDFMYPAPLGTESSEVAGQQLRAWRALAAGRPAEAQRLFERILAGGSRYAPAEAGLGYVALAGRDARGAEPHFDRALAFARQYEPALIGRGLSLAGSGRDEPALQAFRDVLAIDPANAVATRRSQLLALRLVEREVDAARKAAAGNDAAAAEDHYRRAMTFAPDTAALYRELAFLELQQNRPPAAEADFETAARLDPNDARVSQALGDLRVARGDYAGAVAFYERALAQESDNGALREKLEHARAQTELAGQPDELRRIPTAERITRGDLAALLAARLPGVVADASKGRRAEVITDARGNWARTAIQTVTNAGLMDLYPNHTFQPHRPVTRGELAAAVANALRVLAVRWPALANRWQTARPRIADVGPGSLYYGAVSIAVGAGVLAVLPDGTFQMGRAVSGAEATAAVDALAALGRRATFP